MTGLGGLLDRYVLRRFAGAYGVCLFGFLMLFLVVDFFSKLDEFLSSQKSVERAGESLAAIAGEYYLTKLPVMLTTVGPYLTLFAAIATLISLSRHNEITPMVAAGRSHHRVLAPVYAFAVLVVFGLVAVEEHVLPAAMRRHAAIEAIIEGGERGEAVRTSHIRDPRTGVVVSARSWYPSRQALEDVHILDYHDPSARLPDGKLDAERIEYRRGPDGRVGWFPREGTLTPSVGRQGGVLPEVLRLAPDEPIAFSTTPAEIDLLTEASKPGLPRPELTRLVALYPQRHDLRMQLHTRSTRPVSSLVLLLLGLPFVTRPGHKSIAAGLAVALGTCGVYMAVDFLLQQLGNRGDVTALVAAWFAPALFGAIGLARLDRVSG